MNATLDLVPWRVRFTFVDRRRQITHEYVPALTYQAALDLVLKRWSRDAVQGSVEERYAGSHWRLRAQKSREGALREIALEPAAPGSSYQVLTVEGEPSLEERVAMATRAQELQGAERYAQTRYAESKPVVQSQGEQTMTAKVNPEVTETLKEFGLKPAEQRVAQSAKQFLAEKQKVKPVKLAKKAQRAKTKTEEKVKRGRPVKATNPDQKYQVANDNTRSGHMKIFMTAAGQLKKFTRAQLIAKTKAKVTAERAERYFDYCLYKKLIKTA